MLNPRPDGSEIADHYRNQPYDPYIHTANSSTLRDQAYLAARSALLGYRAAIVMKYPAKTPAKLSLLEIGCSTGDLLNYLHDKKGIPKENLAGVEPDVETRKIARKRFNLNIYSSIYKVNNSPAKFDRIVLWHTLEHIHTLNETIAYAVKKLEHEGLLVIALPNPSSFDAKHYRENWIAWDAPRHLYHFVPETLEKLLDTHKLKIIKQQPYLPDTLYNTINSEKLRCNMQCRQFHALKMSKAVLTAITAASIGTLWPILGSSLVYFVQKTNPA